MTPEQLAEIEALAAAATPGPWSGQPHDIPRGLSWSHSVCFRTDVPRVIVAQADGPEAAFIAAARTAVPDLLADLARLRERNAALVAENDRLVSQRAAMRALLAEPAE